MSFVIRTNPDQTGTIRRTYALRFASCLALIYFVAVAVRCTVLFSATAPYGTYDHYLRAQARLGSTPSLFWEPLLLPNFCCVRVASDVRDYQYKYDIRR